MPVQSPCAAAVPNGPAIFLLPSPELLLLARVKDCGSLRSSSLLDLPLSSGLVRDSVADPPGGVLGREETEGDLGGAFPVLDLVRKRRA